MKALAQIYSPTNAITLRIACELMLQEGIGEVGALIGWPGVSQNHDELETLISRIFESSPIRFKVLRADEIHNWAGSSKFFFYPHDVVGETVHNLARSHPTLERILIGDAWGLACDRVFHVGLIRNSRRQILNNLLSTTLFRLKREVRDRRRVDLRFSIVPDRAILCLPVDQTGTLLMRVPLKVPSKEFVLSVLMKIRQSFPEILNFEELTLGATKGAPHLLVTENLFEGGWISRRDEVELYAEIIKTRLPGESKVLVKPHPGESFSRESALAEALPHHEILSFPDSLRRVPIELFSGLIEGSEVTCLSYPTLSLAYLYEKQVFNPGSRNFFLKWFGSDLVDSFYNAHLMYEKPRHNLRKWKESGKLAQGPFLF